MSFAGLAGRAIIVTGGGSGIGAATASRLRAEGANVVTLDLRGADRVCDVTDEAAVRATFGAIWEELGRVDGLFNNAGIGSPGAPLLETELAQLEELLRVNVRGSFLCLREMMRRAVAAGTPAVIVNTASGTAVRGAPGLSAYSATKAAVLALTRAAAIEGAPAGIRVNAVAPGPIDTPMTAGVPHEVNARLVAKIPAGRFGRADEVAALVTWLLSDEATYATGGVYPLDGGETT